MRDESSTREAKQPRRSVVLNPKHTSADSIRSIRALRAKLLLHLYQSWVMTDKSGSKALKEATPVELAKHARRVVSQPKQPNGCIALAENQFRSTLKRLTRALRAKQSPPQRHVASVETFPGRESGQI